jgi:hypothetical protein
MNSAISLLTAQDQRDSYRPVRSPYLKTPRQCGTDWPLSSMKKSVMANTSLSMLDAKRFQKLFCYELRHIPVALSWSFDRVI